MLPDQHLGILLDAIADWSKACAMAALFEFFHPHLFHNTKVVVKEEQVSSVTWVYMYTGKSSRHPCP
jgi:hypothetical protein